MAISFRMSLYGQLKSNAKLIRNNPYRDAAAALVGSLGLIPSINAGDDFVMGEPYVL